MGKLFEIGQAITPISHEQWSHAETGQPLANYPKFGHIYHVSTYHKQDSLGRWYVKLKEIERFQFCELAFAPVISDDQLGKLLESVSELQNA